MRRILTLIVCLLSVCAGSFAQDEVSGVYVGGHIRRERPNTITKLRYSGFTYVILFNVHVDKDGTLMTDGETIVKNGEYVFMNTQKYYQTDVRNLKTQPTSISRIDICIGGWGNDSYTNIKNLVNKEGVGENSILYRNFKALKEALPEIDAVNNDIEQDYDVNTSAKFHIMMYKLGYKTTLAPYTNKSYWTQLCSKIRAEYPDAVDRVMIQCYDGGASNNPLDWNFTGVSNRHAGRTNYQTSMEKSIEQMEKWYKSKAAVGGFVWVYNDETWDLNAWASAMNRTFKAVTTDEKDVVLRCYSENNMGGYQVNFPEGKFSQADLARYGLAANDLSSIELADGYRVKLYTGNKNTGTYRTFQATQTKLPAGYNDKICSITIEKIPTAIDGVATDGDLTVTLEQDAVVTNNAQGEELYIYDITGKLVSSQPITDASQSFSLSQLKGGNYIIRVADKVVKVLK